MGDKEVLQMVKHFYWITTLRLQITKKMDYMHLYSKEQRSLVKIIWIDMVGLYVIYIDGHKSGFKEWYDIFRL